MGATDDNYSSFCWAIWCLCYPTLDDHVRYYATNVLQMRKSEVDTCELAARNEHTSSSEGYVMGQDDPLDPNNATVNEDDRFFEMELETDAIIESLATLTVYNWRSADATDSLAFSTASYMWNNIKQADGNGESSALHRHLIQSNSDADHIQDDMGLMNNINDKTTTLWQTITKASASTMSDTEAKVGDNIACNYDSMQLNPTQQGTEFFPNLSNDM